MPDRKNIWCVLGTRPEAIKLAPVIRELRRHAAEAQITVCLSGQHREMMAPLIRLFDLRPDIDLDLMQPGQQPAQVFAATLERLGILWQTHRPDWVIVQGDTTTAAAAALAGFYSRSQVAHVEAGLRTGDPQNPFPEETNRRLITRLATVHFAPTSLSRDNLLRDGVPEEAIEFTGNTVVDALNWAGDQLIPSDGPLPALLARLDPVKKTVLLTCHRRENHGAPLGRILKAVQHLAGRHQAELEFVFPVHLNPAVRSVVESHLAGLPNVHLVPPLPYLELVHLLKECWLVLTDSGGLQEEAPTFGVPVLVLRETTERPEAIDAGTATLVGTDREAILASVESFLENPDEQDARRRRVSPFGDGQAAGRIVRRLLTPAQFQPRVFPRNPEPAFA